MKTNNLARWETSRITLNFGFLKTFKNVWHRILQSQKYFVLGIHLKCCSSVLENLFRKFSFRKHQSWTLVLEFCSGIAARIPPCSLIQTCPKIPSSVKSVLTIEFLKKNKEKHDLEFVLEKSYFTEIQKFIIKRILKSPVFR